VIISEPPGAGRFGAGRMCRGRGRNGPRTLGVLLLQKSAHIGGRRGQGVLDQLGVCFTQGQADDEWHCPRGPLSSGRSSHVMPLGSGRVFLGDRRFTTLCCHVYEDHRSEPRQESHICGIFNCQISAQARQDSAPSTLAATSRLRWSGVVTQRLPSRRLPVVARGARSGCGT